MKQDIQTIVSEFDTKPKRLSNKQKLQNALEHLQDAQHYFTDNLDEFFSSALENVDEEDIDSINQACNDLYGDWLPNYKTQSIQQFDCHEGEKGFKER